MPDMRSCIKTGCRWPAAATLSYRYQTAEVWLSDLGEDHPSTHDLCPHHADSLRVPRGWDLVDDRRPLEVVREPSAAEIVERAARLRSRVDGVLQPPPAPARSRYAALLDDLPYYEPQEEAATSQDEEVRIVQPVQLIPVGVSHDLGPIVREFVPVRDGARERGPRQDGAAAQGTAEAADTPDIGSEIDRDAMHPTGLRGAVVVQLPLPSVE
ncbi:hypothetical protein BH23ACT9_BH23ACT9_27070 [soil metagenome]